MFNTKRIEELEERLAFLVESIYGEGAKIEIKNHVFDFGYGARWESKSKKIVKRTKGVDKEEVIYPKPQPKLKVKNQRNLPHF